MSETLRDLDLIHDSCPNFQWYEAWKSTTADRLDIDNTTYEKQVILDVRKLVVNLLQPLRDEVGAIIPQSWYRCVELERVLCWKAYILWCKKRGVRTTDIEWNRYFLSKSHPRGQAVDIEVASMSNDDLYDYIKANFKFDQLIREFRIKGIPNSGWVHVSWAGAQNRNQAFAIT